MRELEVIIPVLNEQDSIHELVIRTDKALKTAGINYGLIFVDDNSTDGTVKKIKSLQKKFPVSLLNKKGKPGKAYSILEAAEVASAETLAMIDGDLQYPPEALPKMYELSKRHGVVVANRRKNGISTIRKAGSDASTQVVAKLLLGLDCDAQSGLKVFRREIINKVSETDVKPWALDMPLLHTAREMGEEIGTVEIDFSERVKGNSKVNFVKTAYQITTTAVKLKLRGRKTHSIPPLNGHPMRGAGVAHKSKRYITHTSLPYQSSALVTLLGWQKMFILSVALALSIGIFVNFMATLTLLVAVLSTIYFADVVFSAWVLTKSLHFPPELKFGRKELDSIDERKLPVYSVLCPLYKEGRVLPDFVKSIEELDWPKKKLDVLILLEVDDKETREAAQKLKLPSYIRVIVVPDSQPRTKPKACNYGLSMARGEYLVVYDAEDKPDPLQLKKAYLGFKKLGKKVFCLQSKLNYYNPSHNLLTRLFTAEYSLWFDVVLPGLQSIEASIPLGGTSNHFRTQELVRIHAWDPFNVTEDCDLGVRIFKSGGKTAIIDSTTYEEANSSVGNWIRQRSRWIKGYIQTYLVHMRSPIHFVRTHGIHALIFQLIIGMRMSFMLINPFLWAMTIAYFAFRSTAGAAIETLYPAPVFYMAAAALVTGNFMYIYNYMIGCAKRGHWGLIKFIFVIPVYWVLASVAAFKAISQLIFKPHFWEKTNHGLHLTAKSLNEEPSTDFNKSTNLFSGLKRVVSAQTSAGFLLVIASVLSNLINFVNSAYLGRKLSLEEFGLISLMTSFLFLAQLPANGLSQTISHQTAFLFGKYGTTPSAVWKKHKTKFLSLSILLALLWNLAIPAMVDIFGSDTIIPFLAFSPMWVILSLGAVSSGFLGGNLKFNLLAVAITFESVTKLLFSVLFIELNLVEWIYLALPLSLLVSLTLTWFFASRLLPKNTGDDRVSELKFPRKFLYVSILANISTVSFLSLDLLFVKHFLSSVEAGQYALLVLVGRIVFMVGALFTQFILPVVSKKEGEGKGVDTAFLKLLIVVILATTGAFIVIGPLGHFTVPLLFGERAQVIVPFVSPFSFSMVLFSVAVSIVTYHLARRQYIFVAPGMATIAIVAIGLFSYHAGISQVVAVVLASSTFFVSSALLLHLTYHRLIVPLANINDLIGLFLLKLNGVKPLSGGSLRILVYNWRDMKHVWAGGAEVYVYELAKRWVAEGHSVTLFCGNDGRSKREEEIDGIKIIRRGGFYTVYVWAVLYYLFHFRHRHDVVIESENGGVPFFTPLFSTKPKALVIHHVHKEVLRNHLNFPLSVIAIFIETRLIPLVYRGMRIVAVSESTKREIVSTGIADGQNIRVVTPGVETSKYSKTRKTSYPSLVYIGRHKAYKNIDVAIRAFKQVIKKYPNAKLTIAGEGDTTNSLKLLVRNLRLKESVIFPGKVTEEEKIRLLATSWLAVQPSSFEGWGITVIEANACGTPVIASKVSGLLDSVIDGKTGLLVPPMKVSPLAIAMKILIEDKKMRLKMSTAAFQWAQNHDWEEKSTQFLGIVEGLITKTDPIKIAGDVVSNPIYSYEKK